MNPRTAAFPAAMPLLALGPAMALPAQEEPPDLRGLEQKIQELEEDHADELDDLRLDLEALHRRFEALEAASRSSQRFNIFNPAITVFGNFLARLDDRRVFLDDDPANEAIDDRMTLREVELDFRAAVDPWADGVLILTYESEVPNEFAAAIEEGYVVLKKLPGLEHPPGGLRVKVGRFRPPFGRFNRIHLHDLPQTSYPAALENFLGEEGYVQEGVSTEVFLPSPSENQTLQVSFHLLDGGNIPVAPNESTGNLAALAHLEWFWDLPEGSSLTTGLSGWQTDADHRLYGADCTYKWKPYKAGEWRSFLVGGEVFVADSNDPALAGNPVGAYGWSQYQFSRSLYAGVRFSWFEDVGDESIETRRIGAFATYYTTEFLRLRIGFEHTESDDPLRDALNSATLELNFVFGSHPVEPYWVNR